MNNYDFLAHLRSLDIQVSAEGGKLRINAPKGVVTPEIKSELNARKTEIISLLSEADAIAIERQDGELPLSLAQEHLWNLHRLTPDTLAYNMHVALRLCGQLNVAALEKAIRDVVERHQILRSSFPKSIDNRPIQSIAPTSSIVLNQRTVPATISSDELQSVITTEIRFPFDLSAGPLFRPTLLQIDSNEHVLILVMHHIISDGQSFGILLNDLGCAYRAASEGRDVDWKPLPLQYVDFAAWQRKWLETAASASDRSFWLDQFSDAVPALELPLDHPHPLLPAAQGSYIELGIESLSTALNELCRREGVTLFAAALTAFYTLLHRHSGQHDLLLCIPVAGRDRIEFSDLIGYFNNTVLLRADLTKTNTLRELLQQTQTRVMNALAHQMFPFREVASFAGLERTPLSRAMVVVQIADDISLELPNITVEKVPAFNHAVQYDLSLEITVASNQLTGRVMYRTALFEDDTIIKLADEYLMILNELSLYEDQPVSQNAFVPQTGSPAALQDKVSAPFVAPRNALERRLAKIWQDILKIENVGIHDGFFELGGNSLLALRLFTRIEQETGTNLPLATLFETTTIARLAQLIQGESITDFWECLVPIQPRGSKQPFFCVHGIGGGVLGYRDLAKCIGEDQPVFGLQAVGQDGSVDYDRSIEAMASRYIDVMRSQQPQGPYRIGGYCFGGVVAYEMVSQLEKMGEQVSVLAIFEGAMPDDLKTRTSLFARLKAILNNLPTWINDYKSMSPYQLRGRIRTTFEKVQLKFQRDPEAARRARVQETMDIDINDITRGSILLTDVHMDAAVNYAPEPIQGRVTLFRARNRSVNEIVFGSLDLRMGWGRFAKGGVDVRLVDGFHRNLHLAPHAKSLAEELKMELDCERKRIDSISKEA